MAESWSYFLSDASRPPERMFFMLHGCGGNAADVLSLAPMLKREMPGQSFVAVAPEGFLPSAEKEEGRQWFDIETSYHPSLFRKDPSRMDAHDRKAFFRMTSGASGLFAASRELNGLLDFCQEKFGVDNARTVLFGYSQGGMTALDMGLSRAAPVRRIVSLSGSLIPPFAESLQERQRSRPPVVLMHGTEDEVIHFNAALHTANLLRRAGVSVHLIRRDGMAHGRGGEASVFWACAARETARAAQEASSPLLRSVLRKGESR
ncbi:MAG: alpha/beta hydrolase [Alphaproteobacteria bacterium]|jgi:phospholipase/carboxylesterase